MLGVCSGDDQPKLKLNVQKFDMTWSSWADGQDGPICAKWQIRRFPSKFLIDGTGAIRWRTRHRWTLEERKRESQLDAVLEKLVREEEARPGKV
jgi:hypothetical protein